MQYLPIDWAGEIEARHFRFPNAVDISRLQDGQYDIFQKSVSSSASIDQGFFTNNVAFLVSISLSGLLKIGTHGNVS